MNLNVYFFWLSADFIIIFSALVLWSSTGFTTLLSSYRWSKFPQLSNFGFQLRIHVWSFICETNFTGESRAALTSKMGCFVILVNGFQPLTIMTKRSILDVAAALDPPLRLSLRKRYPYSELFRPNVGKCGTE